MLKDILSAYLLASVLCILINPPIAIHDQPKSMAASAISRSIVKKVLAVETAEGAGALVRRRSDNLSFDIRILFCFLVRHVALEMRLCTTYRPS